MTRVHDSAYREPEDIYAADRCRCDHLVYPDQTPGEQCLWYPACRCTDHRRSGPVGGLLAIEGGENDA